MFLNCAKKIEETRMIGVSRISAFQIDQNFVPVSSAWRQKVTPPPKLSIGTGRNHSLMPPV